jgi:hypothetical protein
LWCNSVNVVLYIYAQEFEGNCVINNGRWFCFLFWWSLIFTAWCCRTLSYLLLLGW